MTDNTPVTRTQLLNKFADQLSSALAMSGVHRPTIAAVRDAVRAIARQIDTAEQPTPPESQLYGTVCKECHREICRCNAVPPATDSGIVERLREQAGHAAEDNFPCYSDVMDEAASRIETLEKERDEAVRQMKFLADALHSKFYAAVKWSAANDLVGLALQIDNMTAVALEVKTKSVEAHREAREKAEAEATNLKEMVEALKHDNNELVLGAERDNILFQQALAEAKRLREALEQITESRDAGRHDGKPEAYPAHDADTMFGIARAVLQEPSHG